MKKGEVSKGRAFAMCFWAILFIFAAMLAVGLLRNDPGLIPVEKCLLALCSITAGYIGFQTANNGVKGKFFNEALYNAENSGQSEETK